MQSETQNFKLKIIRELDLIKRKPNLIRLMRIFFTLCTGSVNRRLN